MTGPCREDGIASADQPTATRRHLLTVGGVLLGGTAVVSETTSALFADSGNAAGGIDVDDSPTLNYAITDDTQNTNVEYSVAFQVEWVADFDRIEIRIENVDAGHLGPESYTEPVEEGTVQYPPGGGSDGGAADDTYEFRFEVYEVGSGTPVITETVTDVADGDGQRKGDMGSTNSPKIDTFTLVDNSDVQTDQTRFTVDYAVDNVAEYDHVEVTFDNLENDWSDVTMSDGLQDSTVDYGPQGGTTEQDYQITLDVVNTNGIVTDSDAITDEADGTSP